MGAEYGAKRMGAAYAVDGSGKILTWYISGVGLGYTTASDAVGGPFSCAIGSTARGDAIVLQACCRSAIHAAAGKMYALSFIC